MREVTESIYNIDGSEHSPVKIIIARFIGEINEINEFVDLTSTMLRKTAMLNMAEEIEFLIAASGALSTEFQNEFQEGNSLQRKLTDSTNLVLKVMESLSIERSIAPDTLQEKLRSFLDLDLEGRANYLEEINEFVEIASKKLKIFHRSAIMTLTSHFEYFFSELLREHYRNFPESAAIEKKPILLKDLRSYETIDEAIKDLVDNKIEIILRSDFSSWIKLLEDELKFDREISPIHNSAIIELFQRRNVVVHNGGIINRIYAYKTKGLKNSLAIGSEVPVKLDYIYEAIHSLSTYFILLSLQFWIKKKDEVEDMSRYINQLIQGNQFYGYWEDSIVLCDFVLNKNVFNANHKSDAQLHKWYAEKNIKDGDKLLPIIRKHDFSDKNSLLKAKYFALLEDHKSFATEIDSAYVNGLIELSGIYNSSIFTDSVYSDEFVRYVEVVEYLRRTRYEEE